MQAILWVGGALEGLLLARLVSRLLAARPDNPLVGLLDLLTGPLVGPLRSFDASQPRFGAVLELSTLTLAIIVPLLAYGLYRLARRF